MRIFWPNTITNAASWSATHQEPISFEIRRRKWMWIGHTLRKPHDDIARSALDWNPQGSRRRAYERSHFEIIGIGGQKQTANKECELVLFAKRYDLRVPIKAIVLPKVTKRLPAHTFEIPDSTVLKELDLADPTINKSSQIDLILGNNYEYSINIEGIKKNVCGQTSAYNTVFGWVLSGPIKTQTIQTFTTEVTPCENADLNNILKKFWEQEEIPTSHPKTVEHDICEKLYTQTTTRYLNGWYLVRLPFKSEFPEKVSLSSSRYITLAQYSSLEKTAVLNDYITLDHMEETSSSEIVS
ncbi:uncharacterized protein LOC135950538 [Calliphora vicina]|uniref:uncharacterized protein LOC135950538 n=1 Tax=Calliphora vicina TaxID=7373 RepID=UPI00325A4C69